MPRKRILFFTFLTLIFFIFAIYLARGPIGSTFFEWYLKGYCRACLSSKLTFKDLRHENGQWVFERPVLTTNKRLEEGGYRIQANQAILTVSPSWWKHFLKFTVEFHNPVIDVGKEAEEFQKLVKQPYQTFHLFDIHTKVHVSEGKILFHDFNDDLLVPVPLFFHINLACKESREGCVSFWLGEQENDNGIVLISFSQNSLNDPEMLVELQNVCCASAQQILKGIWPEYENLEISSGNIDGSFSITFPKSSNHYAKGQIFLKELGLRHKSMDLEMNISEALIDLAANEIDKNGHKSFQTIGKLNILPSMIELKKEGQSFWTLHEAKGTASFSQSNSNFSLVGLVEDHDRLRDLTINGMGSFSDEGLVNYVLDMELKGDKQEAQNTNFHFSARKLSDQWSFGEVELLGFGVDELELTQHLVKNHFEKWPFIQIHQGTIDAAMLMYFKEFRLSEVNIERIAAHDLSVSFDPWGLYASLENASGSLSFDLLGEDLLKTLNANLKITQGTLILEAVGLDNASWQLSGINTGLTVNQGVIKKSLLKGTIAGLKGVIELDGTSSKPNIVFDFNGDVKDFAKALPEQIRKKLEHKFLNDQIKIYGFANNKIGGLAFDGIVSFQSEDSQTDDIHFGFTLGRSSEELWQRWPPQSLATEYLRQGGLEIVRFIAPAAAMPIYSAYRYLLSQNLGFSGFTLSDGWFHAKHLPLSKYLAPFLFMNDEMELEGWGDFSGVFDQQKILVKYNAEDIALENEDFAIEIKSLTSEEDLAANRLAASYIYDFDEQAGYTAFPIRNATYFEKNTGLLFTEVDTNLSINGAIAYFDVLTAFCNGLYFEGSSIVDWSMPGEGIFTVDLYAKEMHGKISQLQHLLSHINKSMIFLKIPIEGDVGLSKNGGHLNFSFSQDGYELEALIQGTMTDGIMSDQNSDLSLQELSLNFDYDHKASQLAFEDIQGTLLVGKPSHVEEYAVSGEGIRFTDFSNDESSFDIWIEDKTHDILRLAGKTRSEFDEKGNSYINFLFNRYLTHFGNVHPSELKLSLKDWSQLNKFQLKFDFQLKDLLADLQRFGRTGLFFLSRGVLKELNEIQVAKGDVKVNLNYDPDRSLLHYSIEGKELGFDTRQFNDFLLTGTKKGNLWSVNQLQIDNVSLAFDLSKEGSLWNINFLAAKLSDYFLMGMEGQYSDDDAHLVARINLLEADLSHLPTWPLQILSQQPNWIAGNLKATGTLHAHFDKSLRNGMDINLQLNSHLSNGKLKNIYLEDIKNMSIGYDSKRGLSLRNAHIGIKSLANQVIAKLFLQQGDLDTTTNALLIDGLRFDIPASNLPWMAELLKNYFPEKITDKVADAIRTSKKQGTLNGVLRYSSAEPYSTLRLHLSDGIYHLKGREHDLKGFVMDYDPYALKIFTEYRYRKHLFRVDAHSTTSSFDHGEISLSDMSGRSIHPLKIHWHYHPQVGFYIQKMFGELSGVSFDLVRDQNKPITEEFMHLAGKMDINFRKAANLMEDDTIAKIANLELGEGFSLVGQWSMQKAKPLADSIFFQGELSGKDFEFFGYRFHHFSSQFSCSPETAYMHNFNAADACGNLQIGQISFFNLGNGFWQMHMPVATISEFRPSLLNSARSIPRSARSLVIRRMDINNINGILGDRNTFVGSGQLTFANPQKSNLQNSILAIPAELLTRIGLDLAVLTPVRGTVFFDIKEGKAFLTRFKDMYSKGRLSKFYLANNGSQSYVDFDGNLNLQIRMKQYNIIFKLAELFTFTVKGNLRKPTYALLTEQKQNAFSVPYKY